MRPSIASFSFSVRNGTDPGCSKGGLDVAERIVGAEKYFIMTMFADNTLGKTGLNKAVAQGGLHIDIGHARKLFKDILPHIKAAKMRRDDFQLRKSRAMLKIMPGFERSREEGRGSPPT